MHQEPHCGDPRPSQLSCSLLLTSLSFPISSSATEKLLCSLSRHLLWPDNLFMFFIGMTEAWQTCVQENTTYRQITRLEAGLQPVDWVHSPTLISWYKELEGTGRGLNGPRRERRWVGRRADRGWEEMGITALKK